MSLNIISKVNGNWGSWNPWTSCSKSCSTGTLEISQKSRQRICNNPAPSKGGSDCKGIAAQIVECVVASCDGMNFVSFVEY